MQFRVAAWLPALPVCFLAGWSEFDREVTGETAALRHILRTGGPRIGGGGVRHQSFRVEVRGGCLSLL